MVVIFQFYFKLNKLIIKMRTIRNIYRSKAHKKYNLVKKDYKKWEHKIIEYKNGLFGISPDLLKFFRSKVKENVEKIKVLKCEMSARNREFEVDNL